MFREALDYPTRPPRGGRTVLLGGTLLLVVAVPVGLATLDPVYAAVAFAAVPPWLLVRGYYVRVLRTSLGHEYPTPPSFGGVGALLRDGLAAVFIAASYLLPGTTVIAALGYVRTLDTDLPVVLLGEGVSAGVADAVNAVAGVVALFALFALMGALYVLPVAVARYAYTGRLGAAFELRTVVSGAGTEDYVIAWFVSFLLQSIVLPVAYLLKAVLIGFYVQFLVAVGVRYCYGQGIGAALDLEPLDDVTRDTREEETGAGTAAASESGAVQPATRPIDETEVPALQPGSRTTPSDSEPVDRRESGSDTTGSDTDDGDGRRDRRRPEGERT